jgi:hypothetical protein
MSFEHCPEGATKGESMKRLIVVVLVIALVMVFMVPIALAGRGGVHEGIDNPAGCQAYGHAAADWAQSHNGLSDRAEIAQLADGEAGGWPSASTNPGLGDYNRWARDALC